MHRAYYSIPLNANSFRQSWTNDDVELEMDMVESVVRSLRSLRSQLAPNERHERLVKIQLFSIYY